MVRSLTIVEYCLIFPRVKLKPQATIHICVFSVVFCPNHSRYDSERIIHEYANHVPFCLVPQGCLNTKSIFGNKLLDSNCRKVEVLDWSDASILDLDVTRDSFEASPNSLSDNVWGWIVGDRPKGIQTTEKMLLNSTTLTAVGEIAISTDTGNIKIQAPSSGQNYYLVRVSTFSVNEIALRLISVI